MTSSQLFGSNLSEVSPAAFNRLIERLLLHLSFLDVSNIDGSGDGGADLVGTRKGRRWVFQAKSKKTSSVSANAVDELLQGMQNFEAAQGAVVTNRNFTSSAIKRKDSLQAATKIELGLWGRTELLRLFNDEECPIRFSQPELRPYQVDAFLAARHDLEKRHSAFLVLATGLGKTVIAGNLIDWFITNKPDSQVLVLAHTRDLVDQLERALWRHLPKHVPTQQLQGDEKPDNLPGVTVATVQTAAAYVRDGYRPGFIFIDEAHHAGEGTLFSQVLDACPDAMRLGATATPWRGDEFDVATYFGEPSYKIGIEDGMRLGYLVDVDYKLFVDNVDWNFVNQQSKESFSIAELNQRLFLPQRDERIRDELLDVWQRTRAPRGIVFCRTIEHAKRMENMFRSVPVWKGAAALHNEMSKREQKTTLTKFRLGDIPLLIAVDILNEGVDVPDVNIVCFARVTHSRRIFIQQLGRGLRLSPGKTHVSVLDFVSDVRRARAALNIRANVSEGYEDLVLPSSHSITFNDARAESLMMEWVKDAADLDTASDEVRLNFPYVPGVL